MATAAEKEKSMSQEDQAALKAAGAAYNSATTDAERQAAHKAAEDIRAKYNYSGGADGSQVIETPNTKPMASQNSGQNASGSSGYQAAGKGSDYYAGQVMSAEDQAALKAAGDAYNSAATQEGKDAAHAEAERIRAKYGYSGGDDGSEYIETKPNLTSQIPDFTGLLDSWLETAKKQQELGIDYATQQGVKELERAKEDAEEQFQTQQDQVSRDEAKALDNQALYAEARGDRGGIGQAQYGQIQATAMSNRRAINSARTKLATDTARQIADLRAQGEFEKADALLQLTQSYLGQLIELQQWGAEYALDVQQFNAQLQQWQAEFDMAAKQWQLEFDYTTTQTEREMLAASGIASLAAGVRPSAQQQAAMGYTDAQIDAELAAYKLAQSAGVKYTGGSSTKKETTQTQDTGAGDIYEQMYLAGIKPARAYAYLIDHGYAQGAAGTIAESYEMMQDELAQWANDREEAQAWSKATVDEKQVLELFGPVSGAWLAEQEAAGKIVSYLDNGWIRYRKVGSAPTSSGSPNFANTKPGSILDGLNNLR